MTGIYKSFEADDIVLGTPTQVSKGLWSGDTGSLTAFYSSSTQASSSTSGQYYWDVYQTNPTGTNVVPLPEVQFDVAYGHRLGGGAPSLTDSNTATLSTTATYAQYRNLLLEPDDSQFTFDGGYNSDHIYIINVAQARVRGEMDPGNWSLVLSGSLGSFTFIDDSGQTLSPDVGKAGNIFNIVSGSLTGPSGSTTISSQSANFGGYGLFYPTLGILVFNPAAIKQTIGLVSGSFVISGSAPFAANTGSSPVHQYNHAGFFNAVRLGANFQARSAENISSTHYFVRVRNKEFNYSNNPTFYDSTTGNLVFDTFINDPQAYITTVGLYNDQNELLAVAKLSRPTNKNFGSELLIKTRIDFQ